MDGRNGISLVAGNAATANHKGYRGAGVAGGGVSTAAQIRGFGAVAYRTITAAAMAGGGTN